MKKNLIWILLLTAGLLPTDKLSAQGIVDPQLQEVIRTAFQANKDLKVKSLEVDKAVLEADGVRSKKLPQVSANGLYGYSHSHGNLDLPTQQLPILNVGLFEGDTDFRMSSQIAYAGVSVRQVIFSGLQIPNGQKALQEKSKAQQYMMEASKENMAKEILASFDQLMLLDEVDKLITDSEKRLRKEQEKVNKAIANGLAIPYDRDKLKLALLELEEKKVELAGSRELLAKKIQQETGLSMEEVMNISYVLSPIYMSDLPNDVDKRSELKALEASAKAYDYLYKKEKGAALPLVFAFGSANYAQVFDSSLSIKDKPVVGDINLHTNHLRLSPSLMVGVGVKWDIFAGGERRNKVRQVQLDQAINETKRVDTQEKLSLLLDKNRVSYTNGNQKLKVGEQQVKVAENNLLMASKQYQAELIDVTELLATENDWYKVNLSYYSNILQQRLAAIELLHTSGKLLETLL